MHKELVILVGALEEASIRCLQVPWHYLQQSMMHVRAHIFWTHMCPMTLLTRICTMQDSALLTFGYLAGLHAEQNPDGFSIGLCAVHRQANGRDVQLKVNRWLDLSVGSEVTCVSSE